jgi:hypothetical protein
MEYTREPRYEMTWVFTLLSQLQMVSPSILCRFFLLGTWHTARPSELVNFNCVRRHSLEILLL